ncbi:MAG TPA: 50S ribosomal protein L35 [Saprospiraceae bacterium]|nr:50S ribosomal protein L35 [Saprospiraceae bacterium]
MNKIIEKYKKNVSLHLKFDTMPKVKTHSGAKKRLKLTGKKKVKAFQTKTSHRMKSKSKKAKRHLRDAQVLNAVDQPRMKALLGIN